MNAMTIFIFAISIVVYSLTFLAVGSFLENVMGWRHVSKWNGLFCPAPWVAAPIGFVLAILAFHILEKILLE